MAELPASLNLAWKVALGLVSRAQPLIRRVATAACASLLLVHVGCGGSMRSRAGGARAACYFSAGLVDDQVARQIAYARCDAQYQSNIAHAEQAEFQERQAATQRQAYEAQRAAERQAREAQHAAELAAIRANPRAPELGATPREAIQLCASQQGHFHPAQADGIWSCNHGRRILFGGHSAGGRIDNVVALFEGSNAVELRNRAISQYQQPTSEEVIDGFRVWRWTVGATVLTVGGYADGALVGWSSAPR